MLEIIALTVSLAIPVSLALVALLSESDNA